MTRKVEVKDGKKMDGNKVPSPTLSSLLSLLTPFVSTCTCSSLIFLATSTEKHDEERDVSLVIFGVCCLKGGAGGAAVIAKNRMSVGPISNIV